MNYLIRVSVVFLVVCSLILAQDNLLLAQSQASSASPEVTTAAVKSANTKSDTTVPVIALNLPPATSSAAVPAPVPVPAPPADPAKPPQSSSMPSHLALIAGLAMTGVGAGLLAANEPTHQTTCVTYGICPVPGAVHVTGGILIGVGVPLTILSLVKHGSK
jgi:hypothetical protein